MEVDKIYHGDCLEVMKVFPDKVFDMILCDLPYGITACKWDTIIPFESLWVQYKRIMKDDGVIVLTASQPFTSALVMSNVKMFKYCWVWHKRRVSNFLNAKKQPLRSTEDICVFYTKQCTYNPQFSERKHKRDFSNMTMKPQSDIYGKQRNYKSVITKDSKAYPTSLIDIRGIVNNEKEKVKHPTQKPVALFEYLIKTYTNKGDLVLDNCIGSGTTAVACVNTNRHFIGIEINCEYIDIAESRLKRLSEAMRGAIPSEDGTPSAPLFQTG